MPDNNNNKAKTSYRTKARAENNESIANANIYALAIPTLFEYENAVSLHQEGKAYLYPIMNLSIQLLKPYKNIYALNFTV